MSRGRLVALLCLVVAVVAGCADLDAAPPGGVPAAPLGSPAGGADAARARDALFAVLAAQRLQVAQTATPYRPPEIGPLAEAPRNVYQVTLPDDPGEGFIVIYELADESQAVGAAGGLRDYLASGPGRVQAPSGTDYVIRQLGSAVIVYQWLPADAQDDATPRIAEALRTIGSAYEVAP